MWGFWEGAHWRPKAALWDRDFRPNAAARAYRKLVFDEWWTRYEGAADDEGRCKVPVYFGKHRVEAAGRSVEVTLLRKERERTVQVK
jgi:hypothetical protein